MQLGQARGKAVITSALGSPSPVVGKLTSPQRAVTKAPLNPKCQTDGVFGSLTVSQHLLVPIFLRDATSLSLLLSSPPPTSAEESPGTGKEDMNVAKPYNEDCRDPSSATRFLPDLEEEPLCSQLPQLPRRKNTTALLPQGKAGFTRRR